MKPYCICKEGLCIVVGVVSFFLVIWLFFGFCPVLFILSIVVAYIYKNPERYESYFEPSAIYAIVDSKVKSISSINDKDIGDNSTLVVFKKSIFDAGSLRAVGDIKIEDVRAIRDSSNVNKTIIDEFSFIANNGDNKVKFIIKKGLFARNIYFYDNRKLRFMDRIGFLLYGEIAMIAPQSFRMEYGVGDKVKATSKLGYFNS